jgi:hypothetical protein
MRKGILYTPYTVEDIRKRILDTGFEVVAECVAGNCYEVRARKPPGHDSQATSKRV